MTASVIATAQCSQPMLAMSTAEEHYATLLAPVYSWLAGGQEHAYNLGLSDLQALLPAGVATLVVDLGAGFGMHSVPLARLGWRVLAIDSSPRLLRELGRATQGLDVTTRCGDLSAFADHLGASDPPNLIVCMGDTLTHLASVEDVADLAQQVAAHLSPRGRFVATWRDLSQLPTGTGRFIPVRVDADRILTCFLENRGDHVAVHDILHERDGLTWKTSVGCYPKLRLGSAALLDIFNATGLRASVAPGPRGMLQLVADAAPRRAPRSID